MGAPRFWLGSRHDRDPVWFQVAIRLLLVAVVLAATAIYLWVTAPPASHDPIVHMPRTQWWSTGG